MAIKEQDKVFYEELANGDKVINLPITRANNVEGLGRSASTAYVVGDVVYVDNNKKVALKCATAGTTSNTELDISGNNIGDTVTDGSVVWQVCNRTSDVTSVNGKTGDVVVGEIVDANINGKEITLTFADGTTKTLTTQDNGYHTGNATSIGGASTTKPAVVVTTYSSGASWYRVWSDGWVEQGGFAATSRDNSALLVTMHKAMKDTNYTVLMTGSYTVQTQFGWTFAYGKTTTSFKLTSALPGSHWYVCGQGA